MPIKLPFLFPPIVDINGRCKDGLYWQTIRSEAILVSASEGENGLAVKKDYAGGH